MTDKLFKGKAHEVGIMLSGNYEDNANCINVCTLSRYFARVVSVIKVILIGAGITQSCEREKYATGRWGENTEIYF